MTIQREARIWSTLQPAVVAPFVREVLAHWPPYDAMVEEEVGSSFRTRVRPGGFMGSLMSATDMFVVVTPDRGGTAVAVKVRSPPFILGDIFGFYDRYIQRFLNELQFHLTRETPTLSAPGPEAVARSASIQ